MLVVLLILSLPYMSYMVNDSPSYKNLVLVVILSCSFLYTYVV